MSVPSYHLLLFTGACTPVIALCFKWQCIIMCGYTHMQDDCQPAVVHEVAVSASGSAVCGGTLSHYMTRVVIMWMSVVIVHTPYIMHSE